MSETAERLDHPPFHPASGIFPLMADADLAALAEDIRVNGQLDSIVMLSGAILDGRNRWLACCLVGAAPRTTEWDRRGTPIDFVVSKNLHRRQLSTSQKALVAADVVVGIKVKDNDVNRLSRSDINILATETIISATSRLLNVSRPLVFRAKTILDHGTAEEIEAVRQGNATVSGIATRVWKREREKKRTADVIPFRVSRRGVGFRLPAGINPEELGRRAIELRKRLPSIDVVAAELKISRLACQQLMDIVTVADRKDLSQRDTAIAAGALKRLVDGLAPLREIYKSIEPICLRLWGQTKGGTGARGDREAARRDRFEHGLGVLIQACLNGARMDMPHLSPEAAREILRDLQRAVHSVKELMSKIEAIHQ